MASFTDPIKAAFGLYLGEFHAQLIADTSAMQEFADRPFAKAAVWAPGRMIDQVEDMLAAYRKNDNAAPTSKSPKTKLPIMIAAMAKDFTPAPPEFGRGLGDAMDVMIPDDPKERLFSMRVVVADIRTQVAIAAPDDSTARSIALQLHAYVSAIGNRRFYSTYKLAGIDDQWPVMVEQPDLIGMSSPLEGIKNLTVLVLDIPLRATVPLLRAPKSTQPNDGLGVGPNQNNPMGDDYDPSGYLVVNEARLRNFSPVVNSPPMREWVNIKLRQDMLEEVMSGEDVTALSQLVQDTMPNEGGV